MPETLQTQLVREQMDMLSEVASSASTTGFRPEQLSSHCSLLVNHKVKYKEDGRKEMGVSLYSVLPNTLEMKHAKELGDMQSEVAKA